MSWSRAGGGVGAPGGPRGSWHSPWTLGLARPEGLGPGPSPWDMGPGPGPLREALAQAAGPTDVGVCGPVWGLLPNAMSSGGVRRESDSAPGPCQRGQPRLRRGAAPCWGWQLVATARAVSGGVRGGALPGVGRRGSCGTLSLRARLPPWAVASGAGPAEGPHSLG